MTTNKPPIAAWAPSTALHKLASRHNNAPCILTDAPAEFNDVALVRLADYEALQAELARELQRRFNGNEQASREHRTEVKALVEALEATHEEELFTVRQNRDTHFGEMMRAIEQVEALQAECEKLREDAGRWNRWLPWIRRLSRKPYELAAEIDRIDTAIHGDTPC